MNEYTERYKHLSSIELMKIIDDAHSYQAEAVDAARFVIDSRALNESDIQSIKLKLEEERIKEQLLIQRKQDLQLKVTQAASSFLNTINPSERNASYTEKIINLMTIMYGTYVLYFSVMNAWIFAYLVQANKELFETEFIILILPFILLAPGLVLFYMKKKAGWMMLVGYFLYSCSALILEFLLHLFGDSGLSESYSRLQPTRLLTILLYVVTLWYLYKPDIRNVLKVDMNTTVFVSGLILSMIAFNWYWHYGT